MRPRRLGRVSACCCTISSASFQGVWQVPARTFIWRQLIPPVPSARLRDAPRSRWRHVTQAHVCLVQPLCWCTIASTPAVMGPSGCLLRTHHIACSGGGTMHRLQPTAAAGCTRPNHAEVSSSQPHLLYIERAEAAAGVHPKAGVNLRRAAHAGASAGAGCGHNIGLRKQQQEPARSALQRHSDRWAVQLASDRWHGHPYYALAQLGTPLASTARACRI